MASVITAEILKARASARLAITLNIVRETQPDDETLAAIAVEAVDDILVLMSKLGKPVS